MHLIEGESISFHYLTDKTHLSQVSCLLDNDNIQYIAIDTETTPDVNTWGQQANALNPHTSLVRLIQLKIDVYKYPIVIDVKKIGREEVKGLLNQLCDKHKNLKLIAHNASYEYMMFKSNWNICFINIKDSMTAMATLGVSIGWKSIRDKGLKLSTLARELFDVHLDKSQQVSVWSRLNLTNKQLEYAALDVGAPYNTKSLITNQSVDSIIIDGYKQIERICREDLQQEKAFELDQSIIPYLAEIEYNGILINKQILKSIQESVSKRETSSLLTICKELGISVESQLIYNPDKNDFEVKPLIPHQVLSIVNSNSKLLNKVNQILNDKFRRSLDNLQGSTLGKVIKSLEIDEEGDDFEEEDIETGINLLDAIIQYKLNWKVNSDINKYLSLIDPLGRIHRPIRCIGTSTGRMSSKDEEEAGDKANLQAISTKKIIFTINEEDLFQQEERGQEVKIKGSIRNAFIAPKGMCWVSVDYASQELRILAGILAGKYGDDSALKVYEEERDTPYLINPETGVKYSNPNTDLHLQAAIALNPDLKKVPLWLLKKTAEEQGLRHRGKILNFSIVYGKGASGFASDFNVSLGEAEEILKRYYKQFPGMKKWMEQVSSFAQIEGRLRNVYGRMIYVAESNAKGLSGGNTVVRKAINAEIQGTASDMMKLAVKYIKEDPSIDFTNNNEYWAQPIVHDEKNCLVKGNWSIKNKRFNNEGILEYDLEFDSNVTYKAGLIVKHMEQAESDILSPLISKPFPSKAEASISFYWKH